ncbi:MAG: hypothetical protein WD544_01380 [Patescibacteria group bacterium]
MLNRLEGFGYQPKYLTVIRVSVPETRVFTIQALAGVEEHLSKFVAGQECLQFGTIESASVFWHVDGRLSGEGAIHLLAHMLLAVIKAEKRNLMNLHRNDGRKTVKVRERIYRPQVDDHTVLNIVFTGQYHHKALREKAGQVCQGLESMLAECQLALPPIQLDQSI